MKVCCRVDVQDRFGLWTAVTEDVCARGCRIVAARNPRVGSWLQLTLSSDLFPESLEVTAEVAWVSERRVGVNFVKRARADALSTAEWVDRLVEHGSVLGPEALGATAPRLAPALRRPSYSPRVNIRVADPASRDGAGGDEARVLPLQHA